MVSTKVALESQPLAVVPLYVYVPLCVYVWPFQVYGPQAFCCVVGPVMLSLIVKFKEIMESHPATVCKVSEYVPLCEYVCPFHRCERHAVTCCGDAITGPCTETVVLEEHPFEFV
jgi:hypothetical protein